MKALTLAVSFIIVATAVSGGVAYAQDEANSTSQAPRTLPQA